MEKRVRLKTWVVLGRREARTVLAIRAALVERELWYLAPEAEATPAVIEGSGVGVGVVFVVVVAVGMEVEVETEAVSLPSPP